MTIKPALILRSRLYAYLSIFLSVCLVSCGGDDPEPEVPTPTQVGANKVVLLAQGELFESELGDQGFSTRNSTDELLILSGEDMTQRIFLRVEHGGVSGRFSINIFNSSDGLASFYWIDGVNECRYQRSSVFPDVQFELDMEITRLDTTEQIISGTFSGWFTNSVCGDLNIEQGWFDVTY